MPVPPLFFCGECAQWDTDTLVGGLNNKKSTLKRYKCTTRHKVGLLFPLRVQKYHHVLKESSKARGKKSVGIPLSSQKSDSGLPPSKEIQQNEDDLSCSTDVSNYNDDGHDIPLDKTVDLLVSCKRKFTGKEEVYSVPMDEDDEMERWDDEAVDDISYGDKYSKTDDFQQSFANIFLSTWNKEGPSSQCNKTIGAQDNLELELVICNLEKHLYSLQRKVDQLTHNLCHHKLENKKLWQKLLMEQVL
ncbi:hypothetical protein ACA910_013093 [Epithemia clementina (nom. ined.)]